MKRHFALFVTYLVLLFSCSNEPPKQQPDESPKAEFVQTVQPILRSELINSDSLALHLPLYSRKNTKSGTDKNKTMWKIKGFELAKFEVIGDNQEDADLLGWNMAEYDDKDNYIEHLSTKKTQEFFELVLSQFIDNPKEICQAIRAELKANGFTTAAYNVGDLSIESDGQFFFIRRISRNH